MAIEKPIQILNSKYQQSTKSDKEKINMKLSKLDVYLNSKYLEGTIKDQDDTREIFYKSISHIDKIVDDLGNINERYVYVTIRNFYITLSNRKKVENKCTEFSKLYTQSTDNFEDNSIGCSELKQFMISSNASVAKDLEKNTRETVQVFLTLAGYLKLIEGNDEPRRKWEELKEEFSQTLHAKAYQRKTIKSFIVQAQEFLNNPNLNCSIISYYKESYVNILQLKLPLLEEMICLNPFPIWNCFWATEKIFELGGSNFDKSIFYRNEKIIIPELCKELSLSPKKASVYYWKVAISEIRMRKIDNNDQTKAIPSKQILGHTVNHNTLRIRRMSKGEQVEIKIYLKGRRDDETMTDELCNYYRGSEKRINKLKTFFPEEYDIIRRLF